MARRAQAKEAVRALLRDWDWDGLVSWAESQRNADKVVMGVLFDPEPLIRWRAVQALGKIAGLYADTGVERVRELIRKLLWQMNDESGGIIWNAPEAITMILMEVPSLIDEFGHILASHLREEPFERGTHWGMTRLARARPDRFPGLKEEMEKSLGEEDAAIRAYALETLGVLDREASRVAAEKLCRDDGVFTAYEPETGELREKSVRETAARVRRRHEGKS
jgi:hypothetical protein